MRIIGCFFSSFSHFAYFGFCLREISFALLTFRWLVIETKVCWVSVDRPLGSFRDQQEPHVKIDCGCAYVCMCEAVVLFERRDEIDVGKPAECFIEKPSL